MLTGHGREELIRQAGDLPLDGILLKPVTPSMLLDKINEVLCLEGPQYKGYQVAGPYPDRDLSPLHGARILLAEDNEINRQVALEVLNEAKPVVTIARNGREAVALAQQHDFDLVLMDLQMPEMDGLEATGVLRSDERFKDLPIIAMTAHAMSGDKERCMEAGMNAHLSKPIEPAELFSVLLKWIGQRGRTIPPRVQTTPPGEGFDLPTALPGIDIEAGLSRLRGNKELYTNLLYKFRSEYVDHPQRIRSALQQGDNSNARELAHTIRGVAGNLSASALRDTAGALELAAESGEDFAFKMDQFERAFNEVMKGLESIPVPQDNPYPVPATQNTGSADYSETLIQSLKALAPALMAHKPVESSRAIKKLQSLPWPESLRDDLAELTRLVMKYRFQEAKAVAERVLAVVGGTDE